ncbi:MAG TPA: GspH/FimT family pseudopilin [Steroidobacteraceae bacterium]|nr:GspH/FimT family pseudopilin [Steroidobacteraceae bacterium]
MRHRATQRIHTASADGYTLVELVVVMAVAGIMAAYIAPRFWNQQSFSDRGYADELAAALRSAQKAAVITDCPAELSLSANSYVATQQAPSGNTCNPADTSWTTPILSADGSPIQDSAPANTSASPTGVFQFDTQGRLASSPGSTITVGTHTISIVPGTGLIQVQ